MPRRLGDQGIQAGHDIPGTHGPHDRRIGAGLAVAGPRQGRRAERAIHRHRRHGLRPAGLLRLADQHAEHRQAGQERPPVQQHAHDGALLAVALLHPDRPQPSFERDVLHHRGLDRLSRRQWRDPVRERLSVRHAAAAGLRHLLPRQVASHACRADQRRRPLRPLAARARLRALLRLSRRRHASILSRPRLRQSSGRAAENAGRGLSPDRRSCRQGDRLHRRPQAGRARQAVLPLFRAGREPRAPSRSEGMGGQIQGQVRRGLGRLSREGVRAAERARHHARRTPSSRATTPTCRTGPSCRRTSASSTRA